MNNPNDSEEKQLKIVIGMPLQDRIMVHGSGSQTDFKDPHNWEWTDPCVLSEIACAHASSVLPESGSAYRLLLYCTSTS